MRMARIVSSGSLPMSDTPARLASANSQPYSIAPIRQNRILYQPAPIV
jgi:hypothetical protein